MTTHGPIAAQLCDYCHQQPRFSNHQFCSKTCAAQAGVNTNMCNQCHKKPKFQNFEFCGKSCATQANPQRRNATNGSNAAQRPKGNNPSNAQQPAFNAMQVAQFVAQQVPQVKAFLAAVSPTPGVAPIQQNNPVIPMTQPAVPVIPQNNPFLQQQAPLQAVNGTLAASSNSLPGTQQSYISAQPPANITECLIPGCGQSVHVDAKGMKTSDYCSKRHREEAVTSGIAAACIMCLVLPQSGTDYFCSKACREEAMAKMPQ